MSKAYKGFASEAIAEIERLHGVVRSLRDAWFQEHLQAYPYKSEWETKDMRARRDKLNLRLRTKFDAQTEAILAGEFRCLMPRCVADMDAKEIADVH